MARGVHNTPRNKVDRSIHDEYIKLNYIRMSKSEIAKKLNIPRGSVISRYNKYIKVKND